MSQLLGALSFLLRREVRERYPTPYASIGELIGLVASLAVYWYTARAFAPGFSEKGAGYFHYLLIGELTLFAPLALLQGLPRMIRQCAGNGTLEAMLAQPVSPVRVLAISGGAQLPLELLRVLLTVALAALFFGFVIPWRAVGPLLLLQLLSMPVFLALGSIAVAALLRFGRGEALLGYLAAAGAILGGAYFPTKVLPPALQALSGWVSPFSLLLEGSRAAIAGTPEWLQSLWGLSAWSLLTLPLAALLVRAAFASVNRAGRSAVG
ncbi:MAG: ABC transporter permease [Oligoflexia bacterium]|nr:ABC transporter permease [Oligoflexia bacterium]